MIRKLERSLVKNEWHETGVKITLNNPLLSATLATAPARDPSSLA